MDRFSARRCSRLPCAVGRPFLLRLCWIALLGLGGALPHPAAGVDALPPSPAPDTTRPLPTASAFDPEAGRLLRRYVGPDAYGANAQNWDATQDTSGVLYVGNSAGVLVYDGHAWRTIPTANRSVVRSVASDDDGRVFVGAQGEFGVLRPDSVGQLQYVSLLDRVPDANRSFADVWRTEVADGRAYFQSDRRLFRWDPEEKEMTSWAPDSTLQGAAVVRDSLFVNVVGQGLVTVQGDSLRPVAGGDAFADREVVFALPHVDHGLLVGTNRGLFVRKNAAFRPVPTGVDTLLQSAFVYKGTVLPDGTIAVATIDRGLLLLAPDGDVRRRLDARDNPVTGLHAGREGGLVATLDGGLLHYDVGGPFTAHGSATGLEGPITGVERHQGTLYTSTIRATYRLRPRAGSPASFAGVSGLGMESWGGVSVGADLLVAVANGIAHRLPEGTVRFLFEGTKVYELVPSIVDSSRIYAATARGVRVLTRTRNGWNVSARLSGLDTRARSLAETKDGTLWVGTAYDGLYRVRGSSFSDSTTVDHFGKEHGLTSSSVAPFRWRGRVVFGVSTGVMRFVPAPEPHFERVRSVEIPRRTQDLAVVRLQENRGREAWGYGPFGPGRWVRRDTTWRWAPGPLHRFRGLNVGMFEVEGEDETIWIGTSRGKLIRYVPNSGWPRSSPPTLVRRVFVSGTDSMVAAGASPGSPPVLDYAHNGLRLTYGTPSLVDPETIEYQYRLAGQSDEWSDWTTRTEQTYRTLAPGNYTFAVRARLAYGDTTQAARYAFTVLPPWYRTWWAYGLYLLAALGVIAGVVRWRTWQLRRRQERLAATVEERTREIEAQKEQLAEQAERLEELDEAKSRFFANVSHEFRTPLTLIQGPTRDVRERLQRGAVDPEEDAERLAVVERNTGRLLRLVNQILGIARLDAGTYELDARPTDVGGEVQRIARTFEPLAEREDLRLTVRTDEPPDAAEPAYVDREALEHVLSNLLSNAIKFTPARGAITVSATEEADAVAVTVTDTGPGIPADRQDAIFDRFERSRQPSGTGTRSQEGAGIGLAFAADLVDLHGGTIDLQSAEGEGTTVTVRFRRGPQSLADEHLADDSADASPAGDSGPEHGGPVDDGGPPSPDNGPPPAVPAPPAGAADRTAAEDEAPDERRAGKRVLVVDDNAEVRRYMRSILEPPFSVLEAADGEAGLTAAREELPDVILADVMMPDLDGHEMTRRLKANPETEAIPVIMVTARAGTDEEVEGLQVGADDYVTKPFDAEVLLQRVEGVVALQERLRDRLREELQSNGESEDADEPADRSEIEQNARRIIREHVPNADFDAEALAEQMAMSRSALYRAFDEQTDTTPSALITQVRMEKATELLQNGEGSVTQVAYAVGYEQLSSFSRAFREHAGQPPSAVTAE